MAGLGNLDSLYQTFLGQTNSALNEQPAPWQQELLESVNPEKVRRDNIKRALAQASMRLATTPGNFLTGLSAAATTGADSYLTAQQDAEQNRLKAMQLVQAAQQKQQDRRLSLLMDALGVNRDLQSDRRAQAETDYRHGRDKVADERQAKSDERQASLDEARIAYWNRRGTGTPGGTDAATQKARNLAARDYNTWLKSTDDGLSAGPSEEERDAKWQDILYRYGLEDDGSTPEDQTVATGKEDQVVNKGDTASPAPSPQSQSILPATQPPPLEQRVVGQAYNTPKGKFIWTGSGWKPAI